jgi:hypothetical protein
MQVQKYLKITQFWVILRCFGAAPDPPKITKKHQKTPKITSFVPFFDPFAIMAKGVFRSLISTSYSRPLWPVWPNRSKVEGVKKGSKKGSQKWPKITTFLTPFDPFAIMAKGSKSGI